MQYVIANSIFRFMMLTAISQDKKDIFLRTPGNGITHVQIWKLDLCVVK